MSKFISRKRIFCSLSAIALCMLNMQAQATLPPLPPGVLPTAPYHVVPTHGGTSTPGGITPAQITTAYGLPAGFQGAGETIALIESGDDPNIEADLNTFSAQFGLPPCTTANGCFTKVFSDGSLPPQDANWGIETSLDVEWAHAIAPLAKIIVVESTNTSTLFNAVPFTIALRPSVISMSWGNTEFNGETIYDSELFEGGANIPMFAATGDSGNGVWYPSSSPYVTAVGATQITIDSNGNYISETAWAGSGGGVSAFEKEPAFQTGYVIPQAKGMRGVPDVSYNGSSGTPYAVYDSFGQGGWMQVAGTSASTPQWAALVADMESAKQGRFNNINASIYSVARETNPLLINNILTGTNGSCTYYCQARSGYNYVTGLGTPKSGFLINRFN
jgi:subtilase family serine protease